MFEQFEVVLPLIAQIPPLLRPNLLLLAHSFGDCLLVCALDEDAHVDVHVLQEVLERLLLAGSCCLLQLLGRWRIDFLVGLNQLQEEGLQ